jgi:hypothetical protein
MKVLLLEDSIPENRGFFSSVNLILLTLLYCQENNIKPIIGNSVLSLYSDRKRRLRPFSLYFGNLYNDMLPDNYSVIDIAWVHNNRVKDFDDGNIVDGLRKINKELLANITPELSDCILSPPVKYAGDIELSIHYRGCDYLKKTPFDHVPNITPDQFVARIKNNIPLHTKIFVATDDDTFIDKMHCAKYDIAYFNDVYRRGPGKGAHMRNFFDLIPLKSGVSQVKKGFEVFRDCYWLSKAAKYLGSNSNLMYYSSLLSPDIKTINISKSDRKL